MWPSHSPSQILIIFPSGSLQDADNTFLNDLREWKNTIESRYHKKIIIQVQDGFDGISSAILALEEFWGFDNTALSALTIDSGSWFVSKEWIVQNKTRAGKLLKDIVRSGKQVLNYILGMFIFILTELSF